MSVVGETGVEPVDPAKIPQRKLYTGAAMPAVGLGTFGSDHVAPNEVAPPGDYCAGIASRVFHSLAELRQAHARCDHAHGAPPAGNPSDQ